MKTLIARFVAGSCLVVTMAACSGGHSAPATGTPAAVPTPTVLEVPPTAPTQAPAPTAGGTPPSLDAYAERAAMVAASELELALGAVAVKGIEPVDWPDAGLGCPLPGMVYAQKVTPGYLVMLSAADVEYAVHMDAAGTAIVCSTDGTPLPGAIPILPGERIQDGKPWMPVN